MASCFKRPGGTWSIQFEDRDGLRRTISLGRVPKRTAEATRLRIEHLVAAQLAGTAPDAETSRWLASTGERLAGKLARVGLVNERRSGTLGAFIDSYVAERRADKSIKDSTINATKSTHDSLRGHFGEDRPLRSITKGDARSWRIKIATKLAENTVRKRTAMAKTLFRSALEHELIDRNPFDGLKSTLIENRSRDYFLSREDADKVLAACPSMEWRLIFSLARYGGLRCPSEVLALQWSDILWDQDRFVVRCVKTAHHDGHGTRIVPLFPELRELLAEAFDAAEPGTVYVVTKTRDTATNLRTMMAKIVTRAGLKPWPKLFQNLRATRATELADQFPGHVAAAWLGHGVKVAKDHYWQVTDDHFEAAKNAAIALQSLSEPSRNVQHLVQRFTEKSSILRELAALGVGDTGFEPVTSAV